MKPLAETINDFLNDPFFADQKAFEIELSVASWREIRDALRTKPERADTADLVMRLHDHANEIRQSKVWSAYVADDLDVAAGLIAFAPSSTRLMTDEAVMLDQQRELERLRDFQRKVEESEANCCPEDVGFEEWIGILTKRLADAEDRYQSAVHGRAEFRSALKTARQEGAGSQAGPAAGGEPAAPSASSVSPQREKP